MNRTLRLALKDFAMVPNSLRQNPANNVARPDISFDLAGLYHHYYLDCYDRTPPDPDPAQFEYLRFVMPSSDFRLTGDGIGSPTTKRRHSSNELGQAFCRKFLHDHLNITYFAHIEHVLQRSMRNAFSGLRLNRISTGDVPDYFCCESVDKVFLAEAKGRYSSISFQNAEFSSWRSQFGRVELRESSGAPRFVKGFIVATRFACENTPRIQSSIFAEDPATEGELPLGNLSPELGAFIIASHYGGIALKIGQPILASSLLNGFVVPEEIRFNGVVWQVTAGPFEGTRFVGGYYPSREGVPALSLDHQGHALWNSANPLRLDVGMGTFVGVEESIFEGLTKIARRGAAAIAELRQFEGIEPFYSGVSMLRDGSAVGTLEFFSPVGLRVF